MNFSFPIDNHAEYWAKLKFSVIGIVCVINDNNNVSNAYSVDIEQFHN